MVTRKLKQSDKEFQIKLGNRVRRLILEEHGYSSLDAFALAHHDVITKPTLYQLCDGGRDMKLSTVRGLADALNLKVSELLKDL